MTNAKDGPADDGRGTLGRERRCPVSRSAGLGSADARRRGRCPASRARTAPVSLDLHSGASPRVNWGPRTSCPMNKYPPRTAPGTAAPGAGRERTAEDRPRTPQEVLTCLQGPHVRTIHRHRCPYFPVLLDENLYSRRTPKRKVRRFTCNQSRAKTAQKRPETVNIWLQPNRSDTPLPACHARG